MNNYVKVRNDNDPIPNRLARQVFILWLWKYVAWEKIKEECRFDSAWSMGGCKLQPEARPGYYNPCESERCPRVTLKKWAGWKAWRLARPRRTKGEIEKALLPAKYGTHPPGGETTRKEKMK